MGSATTGGVMILGRFVGLFGIGANRLIELLLVFSTLAGTIILLFGMLMGIPNGGWEAAGNTELILEGVDVKRGD
jgi:sulfite exporter TauE/SafE